MDFTLGSLLQSSHPNVLTKHLLPFLDNSTAVPLLLVLAKTHPSTRRRLQLICAQKTQRIVQVCEAHVRLALNHHLVVSTYLKVLLRRIDSVVFCAANHKSMDRIFCDNVVQRLSTSHHSTAEHRLRLETTTGIKVYVSNPLLMYLSQQPLHTSALQSIDRIRESIARDYESPTSYVGGIHFGLYVCARQFNNHQRKIISHVYHRPTGV